MIDLKRTWFQTVDVLPLASGTAVSDEGQGLVAVLEGGIEKVMPSAGLAGEVFVGFAHFRTVNDTETKPVVEPMTVPAAGPFTVELAQTNLISGQLRVRDVLAGTDLTVVLVAPAAGEVQVDYATGLLTFNMAEAGRAMIAYYRYNLTVAQSKALYYEAPTNYPNANLFQTVGVGKGKGRLYTTYYDQSVDWEDPTVVVALGANGIITNGGLGPVVTHGRVVKVPAAGIGQEMLGIEFDA